METIKINDMQTKGVVFIVKCTVATGTIDETDLEATLNVNFNKQEIWYLENEVGKGGTVSVQITNKEKEAGNPAAGFWVNITKVDMESAVKGNLTGQDGKCRACGGRGCDRCTAQPKTTMYSDKDRSIIAQCLTKVYCRNMVMDCDSPKYVLDAYNYFLGEL